MGVMCIMQRGIKLHTFCSFIRVKEYLGDLDVDDRLILKWIWRNHM
jgi:hypothetical protein